MNLRICPVYAKRLKEAGLKRVTISLDSLEDERFKKINGRGVSVSKVLEGIEAAKQAGLGVNPFQPSLLEPLCINRQQ